MMPSVPPLPSYGEIPLPTRVYPKRRLNRLGYPLRHGPSKTPDTPVPALPLSVRAPLGKGRYQLSDAMTTVLVNKLFPTHRNKKDARRRVAQAYPIIARVAIDSERRYQLAVIARQIEALESEPLPLSLLQESDLRRLRDVESTLKKLYGR